MGFFSFIQSQILGMQWLNELIGNILSYIGLDISTHLGASIQFFLYDTIKISILLCVLIFSISYIQSYFPPQRTKRLLSRFNGISTYIISALLGTITPFCSCSSIPLFIGFTRARLPIGVTFAFLISSPMVDLASIVLLSSIFGFKIALIYTIVGLIIAIIGGLLINALKMEKYVASFVFNTPNQASCSCNSSEEQEENLTVKQRIDFAKGQTVFTFKKVFVYILIGVGIGALIHNYIPQDFIEGILGEDNSFSVILATIVGVPIYADIFGVIPIAQALLEKGVQLGTVLALMMAVTTLSLPSLILLKQAIKLPLLAVFVGYCTVGIIIVGYIFNLCAHWFI